MPYQQITLGQLVTEIGILMDDPTAVYWTAPEIRLAVFEAMRVWGAYTNYWRERGSFSVGPATPYYDLAVELPALRKRTYTLDTMVREMQYHLLENPGGLSGVAMSGQVDVDSILVAIQDARNRFVIDSQFPVSVLTPLAPVIPPDGLVEFSEDAVFVHRVGWTDGLTGQSFNLWRQDAWAIDKNDQLWMSDTGTPQMYSEAENAPLKLQIVPPPSATGQLESLAVKSLHMDTTDPNALFDLPDEWTHAVKFAAMSQLLSGEGQIKDALRADYMENRYKQAIQFSRKAKSILRLTVNGVPLNIDSLAAIDAGFYGWRNQSGPPLMAGVLYDFVVINPGILDNTYGIAADVSRTAPIPANDTEFIQMGREELDNLKSYVAHMLTFKCGGKEFTSTIPAYDGFLESVSDRGAITGAKVQYLTPLFNQPQKEQEERPDAKGKV